MSSFWHFFFEPQGHPFYEGNVYGNIVAIIPSAIIISIAGYIWSKTKFWPLLPLKRGIHSLHDKLDKHSSKQDEHNKWVAKTIHELHIKTDGKPPSEKHPHYDL